jgi:two-component system response regulator AtoC
MWRRLAAATISARWSRRTRPPAACWKSHTRTAESDHTTILILGESGTGKGVFAKAIHYASPRASMPLLELNCASLPDALLESELFGFEPGAFTDARRRKQGLLERANHGTLFLDEIANMSLSVQAKVLRVLEDSTFMRLGGARPIKVDVRLVAANNADLKEAVAQGRFREDLYYRLNVVPLFIPPLRERKEDIVQIALDLVQHFNRELNKKFSGFTPGAAELLQNYSWPGNIRELKNVIERTMILATQGDIGAAELPEEVRDHARGGSKDRNGDQGAAALEASPNGRHLISLRELEDDYIQEVLVTTGNDKTQAAGILGIHPTSLLRRLKKEQ